MIRFTQLAHLVQLWRLTLMLLFSNCLAKNVLWGNKDMTALLERLHWLIFFGARRRIKNVYICRQALHTKQWLQDLAHSPAAEYRKMHSSPAQQTRCCTDRRSLAFWELLDCKLWCSRSRLWLLLPMYPNRACQGLVGLPGGLLTGCLAFAHTPGHTWLGHYMNSKVAK